MLKVISFNGGREFKFQIFVKNLTFSKTDIGFEKRTD